MQAEQVERLMRKMRERALAIEADERANGIHARARKANQEKLRQLTKLYFDAGRWAGGSRDHVARKAFEVVNDREQVR